MEGECGTRMRKSFSLKAIWNKIPCVFNTASCYSTVIGQKNSKCCQIYLQNGHTRARFAHVFARAKQAVRPVTGVDVKFSSIGNFRQVSAGNPEAIKDEAKSKIEELETKNLTLISDIIKDFKSLGTQGTNNAKIQKCIKSSKILRAEFLKLANKEKSRTTMIDNLNSLLYCYHTCNLAEEFNETFNLMEASKVFNEATFSVLIRQKVKTDSWRSGVEVMKQMTETGFEPHSRTYHSIILKCVEMGDWDDALSLFKEMKNIEIVFSDDFYSSLISILIQKQSTNKDFLPSILNLLEDTGFTFGPKSFNQAKHWFSRDERWYARVSSVDPSGTCKSCGLPLKELKLPEPVRTSLQQGLFEVAENAIVDAEGTPDANPLKQLLDISTEKTKGSRILKLKQLINTSGPYDTVLDVLNIAYLRNKGFNSFQVKRVAKHFLEKGDRLLVICSSPLLSSLLRCAPEPSQQHLVDLLHFFRRQNCGIFFVDDERRGDQIDDYFILLSIIYHNMNIKIVTADNFFDHVHSFDPITKRHFNRWKRSHQIALKRFTQQGKPIFTPTAKYDIDVQSTENSWHIPGQDGKWLCCTKR